jgi:hypothetical protein
VHPRGAVLAVKHAPVAHHGGNGVLEDELFLAVVFQKHGVLIERPDFPGELDSADKVNGDGGLVLPNGIQERILNILCRLVFHDADLLLPRFWLDGARKNSGAYKSGEAAFEARKPP